ncbi:MAG: LptF/LptG family permease [candidate division KSB1 bacterium]|nr:LptF/LptG family permease [candidate division KSB1 bacterium]
MKILDHYLSRNFLGTLGFALISFCAIYIIIDAVGFMDKFIDQHVPILIVAKYYLYYLPYIIILTLPVATLLASLFSVGQLARYNELIAMQASGLSLYKILSPLFVLGIAISLFAAYAGERFVPYTNQLKKEVYQTHVDKIKKTRAEISTRDITLQIDNHRWLLIGFIELSDSTAFKVSVQRYWNNALVERIDASRMIWQKDRWLLINGFMRRFENQHETAEPFQEMVMTDLRFRPQDIARVQKKAEEMSYWELREFIKEIRRTGGKPDRWLVDLYLKLSFPFANFIIVLFGAPLASRKTRSGTALSFGISLFICFLYFGIIKVGQSLGHNGALPPLLAAWLGNILFGLGAINILIRSNK